MNINYEAGGDKTREAFFKWKKHTKYHTTHCPISFVAGYNAAKMEYAAEIDKLKKEIVDLKHNR